MAHRSLITVGDFDSAGASEAHDMSCFDELAFYFSTLDSPAPTVSWEIQAALPSIAAYAAFTDADELFTITATEIGEAGNSIEVSVEAATSAGVDYFNLRIVLGDDEWLAEDVSCNTAAGASIELSDIAPTVIVSVAADADYGRAGNDVTVAVEAATDANAQHFNLVITDADAQVYTVENCNTQTGSDNLAARATAAGLPAYFTLTKEADGRPLDAVADELTGGVDGPNIDTKVIAAFGEDTPIVTAEDLGGNDRPDDVADQALSGGADEGDPTWRVVASGTDLVTEVIPAEKILPSMRFNMVSASGGTVRVMYLGNNSARIT